MHRLRTLRSRSVSPSRSVLPPEPLLAVIQRSRFCDEGSLFDFIFLPRTSPNASQCFGQAFRQRKSRRELGFDHFRFHPRRRRPRAPLLHRASVDEPEINERGILNMYAVPGHYRAHVPVPLSRKMYEPEREAVRVAGPRLHRQPLTRINV